MSLDAMPNEIISKIMEHLMEDSKSFYQFTLCQKRFLNLANTLIYSPYWARHRPSILTIKPSQSEDLSTTLGNDNKSININCYFGKIHNLLHLSSRSYSTMKFVRTSLENNLPSHWKACNVLGQTRISGIVELNLYECDITSGWLITLIEHFINLKYLTLDNTTIVIKDIDFEHHNSNGPKCLEELRIINHSRLFSDAYFVYFYNNFPAKLLDLTNTKIVYHKRFIRRFYPESTINIPSEDIFSFEMIRLYIYKHKNFINKLNLSQTDVQYSNVVEILRDQASKHLSLILLCCQYISQDTGDMLSEDDIGRVRFY